MPIDDMSALLRQTESLMQKEDWRRAIKLLNRNPSALEGNWKLLWNCGWCYFKLERMNTAQKYLAKAAQLAPERFACKFGLGMVYLEKQKYRKAERMLSQALDMNQHHHATRIGLALAYLAQGKIEEAEKIHLDGISLRPKESQRYASYADFLYDTGRKVEAEKMVRRANKLRGVN
jgi:tetratricopeptide (TPR) repeat protein